MARRLLELVPTGLFGEAAIPTALDGREELSKPFEFTLTIVSPMLNLKPEQIIGQPLAVRIDRGEEEPRFIHGYINSFWLGNNLPAESTDVPFRVYRIRLVPWMWFLTRASRCFVYLPEKEEKSIQDVLDEVIQRVKSYGHVDPKLESGNAQVLGSRKVEHCVQYRETDFNFLSRTLEKYGIYYYFKHAEDKHTLVLSDQKNYPNAPESSVRFPGSLGGIISDDVISGWEHAYEFVSGKWEHTDYDFINPSTNLKVNALKHSSIPLKNNSAYELYEYPGEYVVKGDGQAEAAIRLEAEESRFDIVSGASTCKTFSPGSCFKLTEHPTSDEEKGKTYLLTSVSHAAFQPGPYSGSGEVSGYSNTFSCMSRDSQFRPPQSTPQPVLASVQTAVVVGPPGEEIYTDKYGRVKVQFHWDREGKRDENTSCWVRVTQVHAGKGFGGIDIPRVGEEVVVSFLEGDLDRPLITGRVYHKESMPPFGLPAAKTVSGIKTKTYKGGGYNELSMDDTPGKEKINIHAQYDMATKVEHDDSLTVINNRTISVTGTHTESVKGATKITILEGTYDHKVSTGKASYHVQSDLTENYMATQTTKVTSNISIDSGAKIAVTAKDQITLQTGDSLLTMKSDGTIQLIGKAILIQGNDEIKQSSAKIEHTAKNSAQMGVNSQVVKCDTTKVAVSGAAINSSAVGMHEISGALVKIN